MNIQVMSYTMPSSVPWKFTLSISGRYKEKSKVLSTDNLIKYLKKAICEVSRFGKDGEIQLTKSILP